MQLLTLVIWDSQQPDPRMQTLTLVIGYLLCVLIGVLGAIAIWKIANANLSRLISEPNGDASLSRFQFLIFTFVIALSLFLVIVAKGDFPTIPGTVLSLLGISGSSYLVSKGIQFSDPNGIQDRSVEVMISPTAPALRVGQTQQFKAEVPRKQGATLQWRVTAGYGTITAAGLYTADVAAGPAAPQVAQGAAPPPAPQLPVHATIQVMADGDPDLVDLAVVTINA